MTNDNNAAAASAAPDLRSAAQAVIDADDAHSLSQANVESLRAALAEPAQAAAPSASVEQEAMQMLWDDQQPEEKEHYRNVARGAELPLYAIHHPEDIDKTKRRAVPAQPAAPAQAGEYPDLPEWSKRDDLGGLVPSEVRQALRKYVDADRAARGAAQAAPVDAENEIDLLAEAALCERLDACLAAAHAAQEGK